jgi:hypothetical protein
MVPWWKRLLYSLESWVIAAIVSGFFFVITEKVGLHPDQRVTVADIGAGLAIIILTVFLFSLPGWLLAIPIVLAVRNIRGWRFWMYFVLGSSIGPVWFLGMGLYFSHTSPNYAGSVPGPIDLYYRPAAVSSLTTLLYLLLLRGAQEEEAKKNPGAESRLEHMHY